MLIGVGIATSHTTHQSVALGEGGFAAQSVAQTWGRGQCCWAVTVLLLPLTPTIADRLTMYLLHRV
jgi:hypothetical protein